MNLLAPHLTHENVGELIQAAARKCNREIAELLPARFPAPAPIPAAAPRLDNAPVASSSACAERAKTMPVSADRFALQLTMDRSTHDRLRHAQELLGHQMRSGDLAGLLDRALDALIRELEKRKFAASAQPRTPRRRSRNEHPSTIPASIKRTVWQRDRGQCTS